MWRLHCIHPYGYMDTVKIILYVERIKWKGYLADKIFSNIKYNLNLHYYLIFKMYIFV